MSTVGSFNESPRGLGIAAGVALLLALAGGLIWFDTGGEASLEAAHEAREAARLEQAETVSALAIRLTATRGELSEAEALRTVRREHADYLGGRIEETRTSLRAGREAAAPFLAELETLETTLADQRRERTQLNVALHDLADRLATQRATVRSMEQRAQDDEGRLADARRRLASRETSRFPARSAAASLLEWRDGRPAFLLNVSQDLVRISRVQLGLLGSLGRARATDATLIEAGLYLSLPLRHRRIALDLTGGVGRWQAPRGADSPTSSFAGLLMRWAPLPRERVWLVAGLHHADAETALRIGAALGR